MKFFSQKLVLLFCIFSVVSCFSDDSSESDNEINQYHDGIEGTYTGNFRDILDLDVTFNEIDGLLYLVRYDVKYQYENKNGETLEQEQEDENFEKGLYRASPDEEEKDAIIDYFHKTGTVSFIKIKGFIRNEEGKLVFQVSEFHAKYGETADGPIEVNEEVFSLEKK